MIFSKTRIKEAIEKGEITISPFSEGNFREASYKLHLELTSDITLQPGGFVIVKTAEKITLSPNVACMVMTKRSAAEQGIDACQSDLFCEPDTDAKLVLLITNGNTVPVTISNGMAIAKAVFIQVI